MNKRAFTLIELLAVIILIGLLSIIVVVSVSSYLSQANQRSYDTLVESIKTSTELYLANHSSDYPQLDVVGSTFDIELNDLVKDNYINSKIIDERTKTQLPLTTKVHVTVTGKNKVSVTF